VRKFLLLLLKPNGYVLEQLYSPLVVVGGETHDELKAIARGCITRRHARHYRGFAHGQAKLLAQEDPPRVKTVLYLYRVLLTGIHLLRTGEVEANLPRLLEARQVPGVDDLIARKRAGTERGTLATGELAAHEARFAALHAALDEADRGSHLPEDPTTRADLDAFLVRLRLQRF
jgi:predicted nucleotidyltransferase